MFLWKELILGNLWGRTQEWRLDHSTSHPSNDNSLIRVWFGLCFCHIFPLWKLWIVLGRHLSYPGRAAEYIWLCGMLESGDYTFSHKVASTGFELKTLRSFGLPSWYHTNDVPIDRDHKNTFPHKVASPGFELKTLRSFGLPSWYHTNDVPTIRDHKNPYTQRFPGYLMQ